MSEIIREELERLEFIRKKKRILIWSEIIRDELERLEFIGKKKKYFDNQIYSIFSYSSS
jgi:hypothetical protein